MTKKEARAIVARAVELGIIDREEGARRHRNISRVTTAKRVHIWVSDLELLIR